MPLSDIPLLGAFFYNSLRYVHVLKLGQIEPQGLM